MRTKEHFLTLDFLRGTAALSVLMFHWFAANEQLWFRCGYLAVDFFFLLSGFVIAHSYEAKLLGSMSKAQFLWIRLVRLHPMILAGIAFGLALQLLRSHFSPDLAVPGWEYAGLVALNVLMIPVFFSVPFSVRIYPLDDVLWSLFFEIVANIAYVLIVRRLTLLVLAGIVAIGFFGLLASVIIGDGLGGGRPSNFVGGFPRVVFSFFLGVLLYRLRSEGRLAKVGAGPLLLSAVLIAPFAVAVDHPGAVMPLVMIVFVFPAVVVLGANHKPERLLARASAVLGALSYPLYVLHVPLIWMLIGVLKVAHLYDKSLAVPLASVALALICAVSWLVLKIYDEPVRKWLAGLIRFDRPSAALP